MIYNRLGSSELNISQIGIGGNIFGYVCEKDETKKILNFSRDNGINFIDTADVYSSGNSEKYIGAAIKKERSSWVLATKVGLNSYENPSGLGTQDNIFKRVDKSLQRLKTDYIDLYQIHHYDPVTPLDETLYAFNKLHQIGKILYFGCSNYSFQNLLKYNDVALKSDLHGFTSIQIHYNILKRLNAEKIIPFCKEKKIGILAYGALGRGVLSGKYLQGIDSDTNSRAMLSENVRKDITPEIINTLNKMQSYAHSKYGLSLQQFVVAWLLKQNISSVILGLRNIDQVRSFISLKKIDIDIGETDKIIGSLSQFDSISLGG